MSATTFEMNLSRCRCKHADVEHVLIMLPDFTPVGAGACNVCGPDVCPAFVDPALSSKAADADRAEKQQQLEMVINDAQMAFVQRMVDDASFYDNIRKVVLVNRTNFLTAYLEALSTDEEKDLKAIESCSEQMFKDLLEIGMINASTEPLKARMLRWKSLIALKVATLYTKVLIRAENKQASR